MRREEKPQPKFKTHHCVSYGLSSLCLAKGNAVAQAPYFPVSVLLLLHVNIQVPNERRLTSCYFLLVNANDLDSASYLSTQLAIELNGTYSPA